MKKWNKIMLLIFLVGIVQIQAKADRVDTSMILISPADPNILYTGRIDFRNRNAPAFAYPGVSAKFKFTGDALDVLLQELGEGGNEHTNYLNVIIDKQEPIVVKLQKNKKIYYLARHLDPGEHTVEIFKRTESSVGSIILHGFRLRKGNQLLPVSFPNERRIEFIGNSLTAGYGNERSYDEPPAGNPNTGFHSEYQNNYLAWGALASRALKARYMCTAYSGRGVYRNYLGTYTGTMPQLYDFVFPDKQDAVWEHRRFVPDVIVVSLGTNDFATGVPDSVAFCDTYLKFVAKLREIHPKTQIVCVAGNALIDTWPPGEFRWTKQRNYVQSIVAHAQHTGDASVHYFELKPQTPPYGEDWHPTTATHREMADAIIPFLKKVTGWE
jgi:lysophospholipase L1-like esterase